MTLQRRHFLFLISASAGAVTLNTTQAYGATWMDLAVAAPAAESQTNPVKNPFQVPPLPYAYNALEPHIDARTMQFHHDKHHTTYVNNLNTALAKYPNLQDKTAEQLLRDLNSLPKNIRTAMRNNGGGHVNHSMFWKIMSPNGGGEPTGAIASAIQATFGGFAAFKQQFNSVGEKHFGSGWVWLVRTPNGKLQIIDTLNQDSPLMQGYYPIMGNDVWEHAYYLKYQNRRQDYLSAWWNVVNWAEINRRLQQASQQT